MNVCLCTYWASKLGPAALGKPAQLVNMAAVSSWLMSLSSPWLSETTQHCVCAPLKKTSDAELIGIVGTSILLRGYRVQTLLSNIE